jgi:hypothetical protein
MVKQQVDWFKSHRAILESDIVHGRRADGRDVDWMLHVNPQLNERGMLLVYNPLDQPAERTLSVNLYYTGLEDTATIRDAAGIVRSLPLARDYRAEITVAVPAHGMSSYVISAE